MITKKLKDSTVLLTVSNCHIKDCGKVPTIGASRKYLGYFENSYGEQWVFVGDYKKHKAVLFGGDCGWQLKFDLTIEKPPECILNQPGQAWLISCMMALTGFNFDTIAKNWSTSQKQASKGKRRK